MKKRWLYIALEFISTAILAFILFFLIVYCLKRFVNVQSTTQLSVPIVCSLIVSSIVAIIEINHTRKLREGRLGFWLYQNLTKITFSYMCLVLFLISVAYTAGWTKDRVIDILLIEWTIFGITAAVFVVWKTLVFEYFRNKQPIASDKDSSFQRLELLFEKCALSNEIESSFFSTILLTISLCLLLTATTLAYMVNASELAVTQIIIRGSFYSLTNALFALFFDIVKQVKEDRDSLKEINKVTKEELVTAEERVHTDLKVLEEMVADLEANDLSLKQKRERIVQLRKLLDGIYGRNHPN